MDEHRMVTRNSLISCYDLLEYIAAAYNVLTDSTYTRGQKESAFIAVLEDANELLTRIQHDYSHFNIKEVDQV